MSQDRTTTTTTTTTASHRRRTSNSVQNSPVTEDNALGIWRAPAAERASGLERGQGSGQLPPNLPAIPGTPPPMSLSRSPSPAPSGGWSSPGLTVPKKHGRRSPSPFEVHTQDGGVTWASAQARSADVKGFNPLSTRRTWLARNLSLSLPRFNYAGDQGSTKYAEKEKLGRGRLPSSNLERLQNLAAVLLRAISRLRAQFAILLGLVLLIVLFYKTPAHRLYKRTSFLGGGNKFVVILAANQGGGVMEWKGPREWAIERDSVRNKKRYAARHGYDLEIVDMATKKRYAHEWRESWEKVDTIRRCMREYPKAEWFWWLDLNTFIMEPSYSLQKHIFDDLTANTYRDINEWNPLNITHPPQVPYLDYASLSPVGDNDPDSINMVVPQDCSGFNLGSFFMRRSPWTDRLLDIWWDPVHYEQRHMQWEHKEQDAFEYLYTSQPWVRPHTAFIPQRKVNAFPQGACGENNTRIHYSEQDRDFIVNMAGCEWGRDCWGEMYNFRELSERLNRSWWRKVFGGGKTEVSLPEEETKFDKKGK